MCDAWCDICDVWCVMRNFTTWLCCCRMMWDVWWDVCDVICDMCDVWWGISQLGYAVARCQAQQFQSSNTILRTSQPCQCRRGYATDFETGHWCVMSEVWCLICDIWYVMWDMWCEMCDMPCVMCDVGWMKRFVWNWLYIVWMCMDIGTSYLMFSIQQVENKQHAIYEVSPN